VASHHARPFLEAALAPGDLLHLLDPVEAAVFNGDSELAEHVVVRYRRAKVEAASPHAEMLVAGARALCVEPFDASLYEEALALPAAAEFWFDRARIELRYGQRLRRARETLPARRHLEVALDLFDSMRAAPWAEQARAELLATNPATNPRMSKPADRARPPLTAQEARVSELAAEGLSNAQIGERLQISARTVGAHLHHVFEKTGAKNRAMLAATLIDADTATAAQGPPDDKLRGQRGGQVEGQVVGVPPGLVGTEDAAEGTR
jgi:DNA-binding CsgD family transcriptional regulator